MTTVGVDDRGLQVDSQAKSVTFVSQPAVYITAYYELSERMQWQHHKHLLAHINYPEPGYMFGYFFVIETLLLIPPYCKLKPLCRNPPVTVPITILYTVEDHHSHIIHPVHKLWEMELYTADQHLLLCKLW